MIKVAHIADVHLDTAFASLSGQERRERRLELREAFSRVCEICREESVDVMLIAGDLFESDCLLPDTPSFVSRILAGIPDTQVFISPGNHDPYGTRSPYRSASFSDNVHIFTEPKMTSIELPALNTTVYGYGFDSPYLRGNPLERFAVADKSRINLLCAHADLGSADSPYCGITEESLSRSHLDYAALGHIHAPSGFKRLGKTLCAYSGCLVGRGYDECGMRGMIIGEITLGGASMKYRTVSERRYESIDIDLSNGKSEAEAVSELREKCKDFDSKVTVRAILRGTVSEKPSLTENRLRLELTSLCEITLVDETICIPDLTSLLSEQSLRGEFCRNLLPHLNSEDEYERRKASLALKLGLSAITGEAQ